MSIFKYILSPFIEFKDTDVNAPVNQPVSGSNAVTNNESLNTGTEKKAAQNAKGNTSNVYNFTTHFNQLIEDANQKNPVFQGADLKEYMDTIVELDTISDEVVKIKTAFNILKKSGLTKDKLLFTGQEYIKLIEHDLAGIEGAFAQQYKNDVELQEQQVQAKAQELKTLNEKIVLLNDEIATINNNIAKSKAQLTTNKDQFILAGKSKKAELETELQKIKQYL